MDLYILPLLCWAMYPLHQLCCEFLIMNVSWILSNAFFASIKMIMWLLFFILLKLLLLLLSRFSHVQLCVTPIDSSPPGSTIPGILQARILEWVAISLSIAWKWKVKVKSLSRVLLLVTPWTAAHQAPPSMGFSRQEYWSGVPLPSPILPSLILYIYICFSTTLVMAHTISGVCFSLYLNKSTSYRNSFCDDSSRTPASLGPETKYRGFWLGLSPGHMGSSPRQGFGWVLPAMQELQETQFWSLGQEDSPGEGHGNPLQYSCLSTESY